MAATVGLFLFYSAGSQVMIQRVLCAKTTWDGMMGILFSCFINLLRPLVTCFLGLVVYHWINEMHMAEPLGKEKDLAFPLVLKNLTPEWGLRGIVLTGFLAAIMSTMSALANSTATIFSLDVYKKVLRRGAGEGEIVLSGKVMSAAALVVAACVAPYIKELGGMFKYFQTGASPISQPPSSQQSWSVSSGDARITLPACLGYSGES